MKKIFSLALFLLPFHVFSISEQDLEELKGKEKKEIIDYIKIAYLKNEDGDDKLLYTAYFQSRAFQKKIHSPSLAILQKLGLVAKDYDNTPKKKPDSKL